MKDIDWNGIDWVKVAKDFAKELNKEKKKLIKFKKSKRFEIVLAELKKYLLDNDNFITDDVYEEEYLFGDVTNDEYCLFFDSVVEGEKLKAEVRHGFHSSFVVKHGIKFEMVNGQGTAYICSLTKNKIKRGEI